MRCIEATKHLETFLDIKTRFINFELISNSIDDA